MFSPKFARSSSVHVSLFLTKIVETYDPATSGNVKTVHKPGMRSHFVNCFMRIQPLI